MSRPFPVVGDRTTHRLRNVNQDVVNDYNESLAIFPRISNYNRVKISVRLPCRVIDGHKR